MGKKILVVDNDRLILEFMTDLFSGEGHEVVTAEDGLSALEVLKDYIPDIAFVDLVMPNIRGDKLCRIIRRMSHLKSVYIVIVSATAVEDPSQFVGLGADASIAKGPFDEMSKRLLGVLDQRGKEIADFPGRELADFQDVYQRGITKELLYAERHLETILNNISEGILELNPDGKIIFCNTMAFSLFGASEEKLLGSTFIELFEGSDRKSIEDLLAKIGAGPPEISDRTHIRLNGKWVSFNLLPIESLMEWSIIVIVTPLNNSNQGGNTSTPQ